jgi:hypothetical protein
MHLGSTIIFKLHYIRDYTHESEISFYRKMLNSYKYLLHGFRFIADAAGCHESIRHRRTGFRFAIEEF